MSLLLLPNELLEAILNCSVQELGLRAVRLRLVCSEQSHLHQDLDLMLTMKGRFNEEIHPAMFATGILREYGYWLRGIPRALLTNYLIYKTLATTSTNDSLPSTINYVVNVLLQSTKQESSYILRRAHIATICKAAVEHMTPNSLFDATEPFLFSVPDGARKKGGTDHVVIAAVCLNISPVVDAYLSTHVDSHPSSCYVGYALTAAVAQGHLQMTERLLDHGLTNIDYSMKHPLECAARAGHEQLIYLFLTSSDFDWRHKAVIGAAKGGHVTLLTSLVDNPEVFGDDFVAVVRNIIFYGAKHGHLDVVKLGLRIAKGGPISTNLRIGDSSDSTCLASCGGSPDITTNTLQKRDQLIDEGLCKPLFKAVRGGFTAIVQILLDTGLDINEDYFGWHETLLEAAAQAGRAETLRFLLDRGASIVGNRGLRAVTGAAKRGWLGVVSMLCDEGIVLAGTEENKLELNPMLTAIKYDQAHIIDFLLGKNVASIDRSSIESFTGELKSNTRINTG